MFSIFWAVALYHLPNLIRALLNKPAVTVTAQDIRLHQFPGQTIAVSQITSVSNQLGSLLLKLDIGHKKWLNLKILQMAEDCQAAIEAAVRRH